MEALVQLLREILESDLPRTRYLSGDETWHGPRADLLTDELGRLSQILIAAHDSATLLDTVAGIIERSDGHRLVSRS